MPGTADLPWQDAGRRGARWALLGLALNLLLVTAKIAAGVLGQSYALIADGVESATDVFASLIVWRGMQLARRSADDRYPFGYGRAETLAAVSVALLLIAAAAGIALAALREVGRPHEGPAPFTLAVLVAVIVLKETMFRRFRTAGRSLGSRALETDAWHQRSDAITSAAAFVGITVALVGGPDWAQADDWAALLASVIIAWNGARLLRPAIADLMDRAADPAIVAAVRSSALTVGGVLAVEKLHVRRHGFGFRVVIHVQADPALPLREAHALGGTVRSRLRDMPTVIDATVHMEPFEPGPARNGPPAAAGGTAP